MGRSSTLAGGVRAIVLGASNVALGLPVVVEAAEACLPGPVEMVCAGGHGRSYGRFSRALFRGLPGILEAGLWRWLDQSTTDGTTSVRSFVVLTDIGNDLIYGRSPEVVLGFVEQAVDRCPGDARVILVLPPMCRLRELDALSVALVAKLFFPLRPVEPQRLIEASLDLSEGLHRLARERDLMTVTPQRSWYGTDPLHIRRRARRAAWYSIFQSFDEAVCDTTRVARARSLRSRLLRPEVWTLLGVDLGASQPVLTKPDGGDLWLF